MSDLDLLIPEPSPEVPTYRFGTITGTDPLRVRLDGETSPVPSRPVTLIPAQVGDRVLVHIYHRQMVILGKVGGVISPGIPPHESPPVAGRRYAVATRTIPANTTTRFTGFGSSGDSVSGGVQTVSNYGLRLPESGWYTVTAGMRWQDSSSSAQLRIMADDTMIASDFTYPADSGGVTSNASTVVYLVEGTNVFLNLYTTAERSTNSASAFQPMCHLSVGLLR